MAMAGFGFFRGISKPDFKRGIAPGNSNDL
jgi:hypothetical protein